MYMAVNIAQTILSDGPMSIERFIELLEDMKIQGFKHVDITVISAGISLDYHAAKEQGFVPAIEFLE